MTAWVKPSPDFQDNTPITAAPHNANWDSIENYVNGLATGLNLDAGIIDSGKLAPLAVTNGKIAGQAVTADKIAQAVLNMLTPIGSIVAYAGVVEPTGWMFCNGATFDQATYQTLYQVLGNSNTLPDLRDRFTIGASATKTIRTTGGSATIAEAQLPAHTHPNAPVLASGTVTISDPGHTHTGTTSDSGTHIHYSAQSGVKQGTSSMSHTGSVTLAAGGTPSSGEVNPVTSNDGLHNHSFTTASSSTGIQGTVGTTITANNASIGSGAAYWQPYYAVNYIIRAL